MKSGYATKNFIPQGTIDKNQLRQGFWKDYEVITDLVYIIQDKMPEQIFGKFLMYGEGKFVDGKRDGEWAFYVIEDKTFKKILNQQVYFTNGILEKGFKYFYANNEIACEGNYVNNKLEGIVRSYYDDGKPYGIRIYSNNLKTGNHKYFYPNGKIELEHNFIDGIKNGFYQAYYPNGKTQEKFYYKMGKQDGVYQYYYENGQLWIEEIYRNGLLLNLNFNYDSNGKPQDKGTLKDGNGTVKYYDGNGKVYSIETFKNGIKTNTQNL
jgi:antitoxin component YwqK of YwqJK toxin-antitoxin module